MQWYEIMASGRMLPFVTSFWRQKPSCSLHVSGSRAQYVRMCCLQVAISKSIMSGPEQKIASIKCPAAFSSSFPGFKLAQLLDLQSSSSKLSSPSIDGTYFRSQISAFYQDGSLTSRLLPRLAHSLSSLCCDCLHGLWPEGYLQKYQPSLLRLFHARSLSWSEKLSVLPWLGLVQGRRRKRNVPSYEQEVLRHLHSGQLPWPKEHPMLHTKDWWWRWKRLPPTC